MDIRLTQEVKRAHERCESLENKLNGDADQTIAALLERVKKLEGEIQAMKMRMGKQYA